MNYIKLNYYSHILLTSKYSFVIKLVIFLCIYLFFYSQQLIYCMANENDSGSEISYLCDFDHLDIVNSPTNAEAKEEVRPSHQVLAIKREIMTYAGGQAHLIERVEEQARIIAEQKSTITEMQQHILSMETELVRLRNDAEIAILNDFERQELTRFKNATDNYLKTYVKDLTMLRQQLNLVENHIEDLQNCKKQTENSIESYEDQFWESYNNKYRS